MREHDDEPIRGLPEALPAGERILWQGAPEWHALARRALHLWKVALYCIILLAWNATAAVMGGATIGDAFVHTMWILPLPMLAVGILAVLGWLYARTTVYTLTNRRLVIRSGVALPMAVNLPFSTIKSASLKTYGDGTGDIPFVLAGDDRVAYAQLWPNVRPWHFNTPQPMLRAVPDATNVAQIVGRALADYASEHGLPAATTVQAEDAAGTDRLARQMSPQRPMAAGN